MSSHTFSHLVVTYSVRKRGRNFQQILLSRICILDFIIHLKIMLQANKYQVRENKHSAHYFCTSSSLPTEFSTPQGSLLWKEPNPTFPFFLKYPHLHLLIANIKNTPSVKSEKTISSETYSKILEILKPQNPTPPNQP